MNQFGVASNPDANLLRFHYDRAAKPMERATLLSLQKISKPSSVELKDCIVILNAS